MYNFNCKTWNDLGLSQQRKLQAVSLAEHERVDAKVGKQEAELHALRTQLAELQVGAPIRMRMRHARFRPAG